MVQSNPRQRRRHPTENTKGREYAREGSGTHGHQPQDARRSAEGGRPPRSALRKAPGAREAGSRREGAREGGAGQAQEAAAPEGHAPRAVSDAPSNDATGRIDRAGFTAPIV